MNERTVTKEQVVGAADTYGALIMFQAKMFTEDDLKAAKVYDNVVWDIPIILAKPTEHLSHVSQILQHVRMVSIQLLKDDPLFDPWGLWKQEPVYFTLLDEHRTLYFKTLFWYRFFRNNPDAEIAYRLEIPVEEVTPIMKKMLSEMAKGMSRYIREHPNG